MLATKENVARLSILAVSLLIAIKVVASILTGSIAILADAVHSVIDLSGVVIGYIGIRVSAKPADEEHAFGHGKAENIAGGIIAGLIFVAAGIIFYQAVRNLITGAAVELVTAGIFITAGAIVINLLISRYALKVARATDSLLVAVLIAVTAYFTIRKSLSGLMDTRLPKEEEDELIAIISEHTTQVAGFHKLRTRKAGSQRFIDLHLMLPKNASVEEAHQMCDHLEQDIENRLPNSSVTIHVEPCSVECEQCLVSPCSLRPAKDRDK